MLSRQMPWKPSQPATTSQLELDLLARRAGSGRAANRTPGRPPRRHRPRTSSGRPVSTLAAIQVLDDLLLPVDGDAAAVRKRGEIDPVPAPGELQLDPLVDEALAAQTVAHADLVQQVDRPLLEDARADPLFDVLAAPRLEHDRVDALEMQQVREDEP